ncbi:outer membrane protein [Ollibium composti]|uniref:Porin family protein n=1 Tax=Ollibium composti TaxID=2675109 RepID=A0ABY2Q1A7_9HYPH|nr:outer membrane protein [Mesorhizobium composti]THF54621.1 porin family protein [Mesorhizobium composti]
MTTKLRIVLALAAAASALPLSGALAADYDPPIYVDEAPEYVPVEVGSGWYLRGDVGYVFNSRAGNIDYRTFDPGPPGSYSDNNFATRSMKTDVAFGGGIGYHFTDWLRADATVEGFDAKFNGTTVSDGPCTGAQPATTTCRSEDSSKFTTIGIMANGYVDLGTYSGFTPYVGGGLGYSLVHWKGLDSNLYCVGADCTTAASVASSQNGGEKDWRFTYALMAGVAYDISKNLKLDVGYKYKHIQGGNMFGWDAGSAAAGATGIQGRDGGFDTHEFKVGLRYDLW